jgi:MOSC domain-containing protein YiiM
MASPVEGRASPGEHELELLSVNIGQPASVAHGKRRFHSGILKRPTDASVLITTEGLTGDAILNRKHHGGPDQAVYAYSVEDYEWWGRQLGATPAPGTFGENLTILGLPTNLAIGDRIVAGELVLEATAPRIPCGTLAAVMQDSNFGLAFRKARRPGIYFRVLTEGSVQRGDRATLLPAEGTNVDILALFDIAFASRPSVREIRRLLAAPVAERVRRMLEEKLASAAESSGRAKKAPP